MTPSLFLLSRREKKDPPKALIGHMLAFSCYEASSTSWRPVMAVMVQERCPLNNNYLSVMHECFACPNVDGKNTTLNQFKRVPLVTGSRYWTVLSVYYHLRKKQSKLLNNTLGSGVPNIRLYHIAKRRNPCRSPKLSRVGLGKYWQKGSVWNRYCRMRLSILLCSAAVHQEALWECGLILPRNIELLVMYLNKGRRSTSRWDPKEDPVPFFSTSSHYRVIFLPSTVQVTESRAQAHPHDKVSLLSMQ